MHAPAAFFARLAWAFCEYSSESREYWVPHVSILKHGRPRFPVLWPVGYQRNPRSENPDLGHPSSVVHRDAGHPPRSSAQSYLSNKGTAAYPALEPTPEEDRMPQNSTFVVDCPWCKSKVAVAETGRAESAGIDLEDGVPYGLRVMVGKCGSCKSILVGESRQLDFRDYDSDQDRWSDVVRVYPSPPKTFSSSRIPRLVTDSLSEAGRSLQGGAHVAACVMLGRALEALCRDVLEEPPDESVHSGPSSAPKRKLMLGAGIKRLKDKKIIDDRLYEWSQQLQAFRNLAAHPEDIIISRTDAEDLQSFVNAIVEYVYDLADRYDEFKNRVDRRSKLKKSAIASA